MVEQRDVLSLASVDRIRFYVRRKYEHLPKEKHAEIVADAIVKIITRQLPHFDAELKETICQQLIKHVIIAEKRPVHLQDIDQMCTRCTLDRPEAQQLLSAWRAEHGLAGNGLNASPAETGCKAEARGKLQRWLDKLAAAANQRNKAIRYGLGCLAIVGGALTAQLLHEQETNVAKEQPIVLAEPLKQAEILPENELPEKYQYHEVDHDKLKAYLETRSSLLAEQQYYDVIVETAKQFNISPVLLFAITGQEQGFVQRDHELAEEIVNNPFNVFHSWQDYNTTIADSTAIAARTIVNLSKDRPEDVDAIVWINRKYAEDPNWSKGVSSLFETIINYIND